MPCPKDFVPEHRVKIGASPLPFNALVARPVSRKEIAATPAAKKAMDSEWARLREKSVWDNSTVREWSEVAEEARKAGKEVQFGYLFGICVEKNSELPEGHPSRKFKGRVVFQGNRVVNQNWEAAVFQDLGNAPATMEASRSADCYGCAPGHTVQMADGEQAYVQADLGGNESWICLQP